MLIPFSLGRGKGTAQRPLSLPRPCSLINSWETTIARVCPLEWLPLTQQMSLSKPENRGFFSLSLFLLFFLPSLPSCLPPSFLPSHLPSFPPSFFYVYSGAKPGHRMSQVMAYLSPAHIGFSPIHIPYSHPLQPPQATILSLGCTLKLYLCIYILLIYTGGAALWTLCNVLALCPCSQCSGACLLCP